MSSWVSTSRRIAGQAWCGYEQTALAVGDPDVLPAWTDYCRPRAGASRAETAVRLTLAVGSVVWVCTHLLGPWVRSLRAPRP